MPRDFAPLKQHLVETVDQTPYELKRHLDDLSLEGNWEIVSVQFIKMLAFSKARWFIVASKAYD